MEIINSTTNNYLKLIKEGSLSFKDYIKAFNINTCIRCCFRFSGIRRYDFYRLSNNEIIDLWNTFEKENEINKKPIIEGCICCLDIINVHFMEKEKINFTQTISQTYEYDIKDYSLVIKLPSSILVRQLSTIHFLELDHLNNSIISIKEILKEILCYRLENSNIWNKKIIYNAESDFVVNIEIFHDETEEEANQIPSICDKKVKVIRCRKTNKRRIIEKNGFRAVTKAIDLLNNFPETIICPPKKCKTNVLFKYTMERAPIYVAGRYLKYQRGLSQTPWFIEENRIGTSSVEEKISSFILPYFLGNGSKFHSAGREDIDVRMLGNGRPFILEILNAKKKNLDETTYKNMESEANKQNDGSVLIRDIHLTDKKCFSNLQDGASLKKKTYCCVVWVSKKMEPEDYEKLNEITDLLILQKTPVRVLHRRTLMTREKIIHSGNFEAINDHYFLLYLTTSAGTYVKEFIHGDLGRTKPNISSILECKADILQLDVMDVKH